MAPTERPRLRDAPRRATVRRNLGKEPPIFNLIQALHQTHELAEDHGDEPGWTEVRQQVDDALERLTHGAGDPTTEAIGVQRIDRTVALDEEQAELAAAAMAALHDRPEPEQLELARAALQQLHEAIG
jgi:hypothetical protein